MRVMTSKSNEACGPARVCTTPACCPLCHRPNGCRLETGEAYKGPCWCEKLTLPPAAARRLAEEVMEARCLCAACLEALAANPEIAWDELRRHGPNR